MMRVGKVMMRMSDPLVPVSMSMSCARRYGPVVLMLMMFIVRMLVLVLTKAWEAVSGWVRLLARVVGPA